MRVKDYKILASLENYLPLQEKFDGIITNDKNISIIAAQSQSRNQFLIRGRRTNQIFGEANFSQTKGDNELFSNGQTELLGSSVSIFTLFADYGLSQESVS